MLDSLKVGYITLNREFQVIDFNSYGIECMMKLWNAQSISEALRKLRSSPEMRGLHDGQMEYQGQIITGHSFSEMDFYGRLQQYYYYTMTAKTTTQTEKPHSELPFELLSSRESWRCWTHFPEGWNIGRSANSCLSVKEPSGHI